MLTTSSFDRKVAWIGNVVVERSVRGKHIGQKLVEHALGYLGNRRVRHVAVYCFRENVRFYEKLGFVTDTEFMRLRRESQTVKRPRRGGQFHEETESAKLLFKLDRRAFGATRTQLLDMFLREGRGHVVSDGNSALLVKVYEDMCEFGPWVGSGQFRYEKNACVLNEAVRRYGGKAIEASCLKSNAGVLRLMTHEGFRTANVGFRMYYSRKAKLGHDSASYLLGFLDKG
jgi:predicted GNAT family acetyltransferase